jgi:plastocyanin
MRVYVLAGAALVLGLGVWGCSNSGYSGGSGGNPGAPTSPSPSPTPGPNPGPSPAGIVTIDVIAVNGAQSFSPNPADVPAGQMVVWHNIDRITHHVVLNDRSVDTGDLAPGASSAPMSIAAAGGPYHCSIHPEMVGSINQATPSAPPSQPCQDPYCG